jgi:hypothetical protein
MIPDDMVWNQMSCKDEFPIPLLVKLCSDKAAFEARPARKLFLSMDRTKRTLEKSKKHEIVVYTPHMLILRIGKVETTLSRDGRMLIKKVSSETEAAQVASDILRTILKE